MSKKQAMALFAAGSAGFTAAAVGLGAYAGTVGSDAVTLAAVILGAIGAGLGAGLTAFRAADGQ